MDKIWLSNYPSSATAVINPDYYSSIVELFERVVERHKEQTAFINQGRSISFERLEKLSRAFAAYLQNELSMKKGDRIALMMPNLLQYPIALLGALRAGLVVVNVNPLYTPRELTHQLADSGAKAIVIVSNYASNLEKSIGSTAIKHVIISQIGDVLSPIKRSIVNFTVKNIRKLVPHYQLPGAVTFRQALKMGKNSVYNRPEITGHDLAFLQYTGGTTGRAKGAMLSHRNILANIEQAKSLYGERLKVGKEKIITILPLYHIFALTVNCLLFMEFGSCNLLITNPKDIKSLIKDLSHYPFTGMTGVNTLFNSLINNEQFKQLDFSSLHLVIGGGASVQSAVAKKWFEVTGVPLLEGYGLTECSPLVAVNPCNISHYNGSIGLPVPSTDIRIVDEQGNEVALGETGELLVSAPQIMQGYWQQPEETAQVLKEGWLATGDIVKMDEKGFLYLIDRKKDMILVSGFNVYPNEIEEVVGHHPKVLEVVAVGVKSPSTGEQIKLYVVKKDPLLTESELVQYCRAHLTGYKVPKLIEFRQNLPKSNVGKILRRHLQQENTVANEG